MLQMKATAVAARTSPSKIVPFSSHQPKIQDEHIKNTINQDFSDFFSNNDLMENQTSKYDCRTYL